MKHAPAYRRLLAVIVSAMLLGPAALADPPADKGKSADAAQAVKDDGKSSSAAQDRRHDDGQGKAEGSHGQVVSDCNHRANQKELKGKDRQDYVEWCTDRGERHQYDDRRYDQDRSCYRKAAEKGLSGDSRRAYIQDCLRKQEKNR